MRPPSTLTLMMPSTAPSTAAIKATSDSDQTISSHSDHCFCKIVG